MHKGFPASVDIQLTTEFLERLAERIDDGHVFYVEDSDEGPQVMACDRDDLDDCYVVGEVAVADEFRRIASWIDKLAVL